MQNVFRKIFVWAVLSSLFTGCRPANTVAGTWIANIGKINFMQEGNKITGTIAGYGGQWNETFEGDMTDNQAVFNTEWFGDFTLIFDGDTFKSASPELAFCGIRSDGKNELPAGCGYTGKWIIPANPDFPDGGSMELKQVEENVTGTFYGKDGDVYDTITGTVYWGKGWMMDGVTGNHGQIILDVNSAETGFMITTDEFSYDDQLCAVRERQSNVNLGFYYCN